MPEWLIVARQVAKISTDWHDMRFKDFYSLVAQNRFTVCQKAQFNGLFQIYGHNVLVKSWNISKIVG